MIDVYIRPILVAFFCFPFLAFFTLIPYMIYEYRKYGSILFLRTIVVYSFILYLLTCYFLIILPLPSKEAVLQYKMPTIQLQLGQFLYLLGGKITSTDWTHIQDILAFFQDPSVYTVLFNVFLTFPFGIYLRYYYQKKWYHVFFLSFLLSLFFELTQLTGLYGIYPRSYRLFDVDDLLVNTIGGLLGYAFAPFFTKFLPSRSSLDEKSFEKGKKISAFRRMFAFLIDAFFFAIVILCLFLFLQKDLKGSMLLLYYCMGSFLSYFLFPALFDGRTIGKWIMRIQYVNEEGRKASIKQIWIRNLFLYFVLLPAPYYLKVLSKIPFPIWIQKSCQFIVGINYLFFLLQGILIFFGKSQTFTYEKISQTQLKSTILEEKEDFS